MDDRHDPNLILGYVEGELDAEAAARVEGYMAEDTKLAALVADLQTQRAALRASEPPAVPTPGSLADAAMETLEREMLLADIDDIDTALGTGSAGSIAARRFRGWLAYGGMAAVLAVAAAVVLQTLRGDPTPDRTVAMNDAERYDFAEAPIRAQREAIGRDAAPQSPQPLAAALPAAPTEANKFNAGLANQSMGDAENRPLLSERFAAAARSDESATQAPTTAGESAAFVDELTPSGAPADSTSQVAQAEPRRDVAELDAMPLRRALRAESLLQSRPTRGRRSVNESAQLGRLDVTNRVAERSWRLYAPDTLLLSEPTEPAPPAAPLR